MALSIWLQCHQICSNGARVCGRSNEQINRILAAFSTQLVAINGFMHREGKGESESEREEESERLGDLWAWGQSMILYEVLYPWVIGPRKWPSRACFKCLLKINQVDIKTRFPALMNNSITFSLNVSQLIQSAFMLVQVPLSCLGACHSKYDLTGDHLSPSPEINQILAFILHGIATWLDLKIFQSFPEQPLLQMESLFF